MGWEAIVAMLALQFGGEAVMKYLLPMSGSEKDLLELQMKGAKESQGREVEALSRLQTEKSTADWQKLLMQLGVGQAAERRQGADEVSQIRAQAALSRGESDSLRAIDPNEARLSTMMSSPTNFKQLLGLD